MKYRITTLLATTAAVGFLASAAWADDQAPATPAPAAAAAAPAAPTTWAGGIKVHAEVDLGTTFNPDSPSDGVNFGHLFTDRSNEVLLNTVSLTAERDPDTSSKTVDVGFKIQGAFGSDARYTELIGQFNRGNNDINQFDLVEANLQAHLPILTPGGMEFKIGQYVTLEGEEVIDPAGNIFYSHSYLFNFGIPLKHFGVMTETHLSPMFDLYLGVDTGVNTFVGSGGGANDTAVHFHGGIGVNTKNVTVLITTHIGPEDYTYAVGAPPPFKPLGINNKLRYLTDGVITWKINDKLTSITDANYTYDELIGAGAGGVVEYLTYALNPAVTLAARGEVWADNKNFYVAAFPGHFDYINFAGGYGPSSPIFNPASGSVTYSEFTIGLTYKPQGLPKAIDGLMIRPELRYDNASAGKPYDVQTKSSQFTAGLDIVVPFAF
jgi:hypothetical protein